MTAIALAIERLKDAILDKPPDRSIRERRNPDEDRDFLVEGTTFAWHRRDYGPPAGLASRNSPSPTNQPAWIAGLAASASTSANGSSMINVYESPLWVLLATG